MTDARHIRRLIQHCFDKAINKLRENKFLLKQLAWSLLLYIGLDILAFLMMLTNVVALFHLCVMMGA